MFGLFNTMQYRGIIIMYMNELEAKNYEYFFFKVALYKKKNLIHFAFSILELHRCSNKRKHLNFPRHFLSVSTAWFTVISVVFLVLYTGLHFLKIEIQPKNAPWHCLIKSVFDMVKILPHHVILPLLFL